MKGPRYSKTSKNKKLRKGKAREKRWGVGKLRKESAERGKFLKDPHYRLRGGKTRILQGSPNKKRGERAIKKFLLSRRKKGTEEEAS